MQDGVEQLTDMVPGVDLADRDRLALMIVDMQYHDASPRHGLTAGWDAIAPASMTYYGERLDTTTVPAIERMLAFFRRQRLHVVHVVLGSDYRDLRDCPPRFRNWTRNLERATGVRDIWWSGNPDFAILDPLKPLAGETVIQKTTNGAFNGSGLDSVLQRIGISTLVITGAITRLHRHDRPRRGRLRLRLRARRRGHGRLRGRDAPADAQGLRPQLRPGRSDGRRGDGPH